MPDTEKMTELNRENSSRGKFTMKGLVAAVLVWASAAAEEAVAERRQLASEGCNNCCFKNDCSLAFAATQAGVCCGAHQRRGQTGCCP